MLHHFTSVEIAPSSPFDDAVHRTRGDHVLRCLDRDHRIGGRGVDDSIDGGRGDTVVR